MTRIVITETAGHGLVRCRAALANASPTAPARAALAIERQLALLEMNPYTGRPLPDFPELRELEIAFGDSGYAALYRYDAAAEAVVVLAFRHQSEAGC